MVSSQDMSQGKARGGPNQAPVGVVPLGHWVHTVKVFTQGLVHKRVRFSSLFFSFLSSFFPFLLSFLFFFISFFFPFYRSPARESGRGLTLWVSDIGSRGIQSRAQSICYRITWFTKQGTLGHQLSCVGNPEGANVPMAKGESWVGDRSPW